MSSDESSSSSHKSTEETPEQPPAAEEPSAQTEGEAPAEPAVDETPTKEEKLQNVNDPVDIEVLMTLNEHAQHILMGLYNLEKNKTLSKDFKYLQSYKADKKKPFNPEKHEAVEMGMKIRPLYALLQHIRSFQRSALRSMKQVFNNSKEIGYEWDYVIAKPFLQLFTYYVKIHIYLAKVPTLNPLFQHYSMLYLRLTKSDDPDMKPLQDFVSKRQSLRTVHDELQPFFPRFFTIFKGIIPIFHSLLNDPQGFPIKTFNLYDKPEATIPTETFFNEKFLTYLDLNNLVESFLIYGMIYMSKALPKNSTALDIYSKLAVKQFVITLAANRNIELKTIFNDFKRYKDRGYDINSSFVDSIEQNFEKTRANILARVSSLIIAIKQYDNAIQVDASLICTKHQLILSLLGMINFELKSILRVSGSISPDVCELLFYYAKVATRMFKAQEDLQRFFLYNIREFDSNYLDTLGHSFSMSTTQFQKIEQLILALRTVNIEEFDNSKEYELYGCQSVIRSIVVGFNALASRHGITHMAPLLQLLSGSHFRLQFYQFPFETLLGITQIHEYWTFCKPIFEMLKGKDFSSFSVCAFQLMHYYQFDYPSLSEYKELKDLIQDHYKECLDLLIGKVKRYVEAIQSSDGGFDQYRESMSPEVVLSDRGANIGKESYPALRAKNKLFQNIEVFSNTIFYLEDIGYINIVGQEYNIHKTVLEEINKHFNELIWNKSASELPPTDLEKRLQTSRWAQQIICSCTSSNYQYQYYKSISGLINASKDQTGAILSQYIQIYRKIFKSSLNCYYSNTRDMFIGSDSAPKYLSHYALEALYRIVGRSGMTSLYDSLGDFFVDVFKEFAGVENKIAYADKERNNEIEKKSLCTNMEESDKLIKLWCKLSSILQLRKMFKGFTNARQGPPSSDKALMANLSKEISKLFDDNKYIYVLGSMFSTAYWEKFEFDSYNEALKDNAHLMNNLLDVIVGAGLYLKKIKTPSEVYELFFKRFKMGVESGIKQFQDNKKSKYPGARLFILMDIIIRYSEYADYSYIRNVIQYHFIRSSYIDQLSTIVVKNEAPPPPQPTEAPPKEGPPETKADADAPPEPTSASTSTSKKEKRKHDDKKHDDKKHDDKKRDDKKREDKKRDDKKHDDKKHDEKKHSKKHDKKHKKSDKK